MAGGRSSPTDIALATPALRSVFFKPWVATHYWVAACKVLGRLALVSTADRDVKSPIGGAAQLRQASAYLF